MRIVIHKDYEQLTSLIEQIPSIFCVEGELLYSGRNQVKLFHTEIGDFVVKRYKRPNFIQKIAYTFFEKSKAERAFLFAEMLRNRGVETPHEIAFIERKHNALLQDSYFISTVSSYPALFHFIKENRTPKLIDALAAFLVQLHEKGILHGDLNFTNILYHTDKSNDYHFCLIDTNRSQFVACPAKKACLENLKRLTHIRPLLDEIVSAYAQRRGWDAEECKKDVNRRLTKFEKKKALKYRLLRKQK